MRQIAAGSQVLDQPVPQIRFQQMIQKGRHMNIRIQLQSDIPTYEQIKMQIKAQILSGELSPDQPLTSMRQLARDLRVSVITTTRA